VLPSRSMSKRLDCVIDGCQATVEAETEAELMEQVQAHAAEEHPDLELDEETVAVVKENIETV
jgi:predicted small metal-binding protein